MPQWCQFFFFFTVKFEYITHSNTVHKSVWWKLSTQLGPVWKLAYKDFGAASDQQRLCRLTFESKTLWSTRVRNIMQAEIIWDRGGRFQCFDRKSNQRSLTTPEKWTPSQNLSAPAYSSVTAVIQPSNFQMTIEKKA